jgi:glycosyltransferase involved in cell wall biosynthesis
MEKVPERGEPSGSGNLPLRITHVVSSLQVGGMEQFVVRIATEQRRQGHAVRLLAVRGGPLLEHARAAGVPVHILRGRGKQTWLPDALLSHAAVRPQIVHAHNPTSLPYAAIARAVGRPAVLMTRHGQRAELRAPTETEWNATAAVVAVSEAAATVLRETYPSQAAKVSVIHNGIEPAAPTRPRQETRAALGLDPTDLRPVGIIVARIDTLKGHDTLLRALAALPAAAPAVTFLIAGDGAERATMEGLATELGIAPHVRFLGFRTDVADLLAASDFFVLPSRLEGLPLSVLEAMAHGLPVIATPVGGTPEVIPDPRYGILTPVDDVPALAAAIARLATDPALCRELGEAGRQRVAEAFSFAAMTSRYDELYRRLLSR